MIASGTLLLSEVRARAAAALAPLSESDPAVLVDVVDAVTPPALMLLWDDPWLEPRSVGGCLWDARLEVRCLAARLEPGPGVAMLEALVAYTISRLQADASYTWPVVASTAPRVFTMANVPLLGARLTFRVPVTIEEV